MNTGSIIFVLIYTNHDLLKDLSYDTLYKAESALRAASSRVLPHATADRVVAHFDHTNSPKRFRL